MRKGCLPLNCLRVLAIVWASGCLLVFGGGCYRAYQGVRAVSLAPIVPPRGFAYSHFRAPLVLPDRQALKDMRDSKARNLLYVKLPTPYVTTEFTVGRVDLEDACRQAGIETLIAADYEYTSVAGYVKTVVIHAYGYRADEVDRE